MQKILILGCPGSGKSTFARKLHAYTGIPIIYLDRLHWNADRTVADRAVFLARLEEAMLAERWIMDGNYLHTLKMRLEACDTVFYLDYPLDVCLSGIRERIGQKRPDMPWIEEALDPEFLRYVEEFPEYGRLQIEALLEEHSHKPIIRFTRREEANIYLENRKKGHI